MDHAGIEPAASRLQGGRLTVEAQGPGMAGLTGFEPALSSETVRRGLRLPYRPRDGGTEDSGPAGTVYFHLPWRPQTPRNCSYSVIELRKNNLLRKALMAVRVGLEPTQDRADPSRPG